MNTKETVAYLHLEVIKKNKYWTDLWWLMSGANKTQYDSIKGTEVIEFFQILKNFEKSIKAKPQGNG